MKNNSLPRVAVFSVFYEPDMGGAEIALKEVMKRLKKNYSFHVFTALRDHSLPLEETIDGITIHRVRVGKKPSLNKYVFSGAKKAREINKQHSFSLCYALMANWSAGSCYQFNKKNAIPSVLNMQSGDSIEYVKKHIPFGMWWYFKKIVRSFDYITTISSFLLERAVSLGVPRHKVRVVPNGVDLELFNPKKIKKTVVEKKKKELGITKKQKIVFTASRLAYKNNIELIIKSMKHLGDDYRLLIAGKGELESELKELAQTLGVNVDFVGYVEYKELPVLLSLSSVFVRPSISEGFGNSFIEAMAMNVPVIATPVGGITDFIVNEKTGLFTNESNDKLLAKNISRSCEDTVLRKKLIQNGYKKAQEYSWDKAAKELDIVFTEQIRSQVSE